MLSLVARWIGVDVGGKRKGFDVAVIDDRRVLVLQNRLACEQVVGLVMANPPTAVAIDSHTGRPAGGACDRFLVVVAHPGPGDPADDFQDLGGLCAVPLPEVRTGRRDLDLNVMGELVAHVLQQRIDYREITGTRASTGESSPTSAGPGHQTVLPGQTSQG